MSANGGDMTPVGGADRPRRGSRARRGGVRQVRWRLVALVLLASPAAPAAADDARAVGAYRITAAFERSPVYPDENNALILHVTTVAGEPVAGLERTLRLRIGVPNQVTETWQLQPAAGRPGVYAVRLTLPRAGDYFMDLFGTVGDQAVNERFLTGQNGLEKVIAAPRQYPRGSWLVVLVTLAGYLLGLAYLGGRWLWGRMWARRRPALDVHARS